jgi:hypothetical protein
MKRCLAALFFAVWIAAAPAIAQKAPTSIPLIRFEGGLLMISGSVGAENQCSFVLDTGADLRVLSKSLVEKAGGVPTGQFTGFRMTGERLDVQLYTISELRVGPVLLSPALVGGWDGLDKLHLDGISHAADHPRLRT